MSSRADYLKRYLDAPDTTSDYKQPTKKSKKSKKSSKSSSTIKSMRVIDNDINVWKESDINSQEMLKNDRFLADVGIDAPQIVDLNEGQAQSATSGGKWKKSDLSKRHDSSDSDDSDDSDNVVSRPAVPTSARRHDSSDESSESEDSDNDAVRMADGTLAGLQTYSE